MITVEFEGTSTVVTVLDVTAEEEDLQIIFDEDGDIILRQFNEEENKFEVLILSKNQFDAIELLKDLPEGAYLQA